MIIKVKHYDKVIEVGIPEDSDYDTVMQAFNGILIVCGFHKDTIFNNENETE